MSVARNHRRAPGAHETTYAPMVKEKPLINYLEASRRPMGARCRAPGSGIGSGKRATRPGFPERRTGSGRPWRRERPSAARRNSNSRPCSDGAGSERARSTTRAARRGQLAARAIEKALGEETGTFYSRTIANGAGAGQKRLVVSMLILLGGGLGGNRTPVQGFAVLCVATPPRGRQCVAAASGA
jgi:hypothetical protein